MLDSSTHRSRRIAVVSAGLSQPSSTRLLADRLTEATSAELAASGTEVTVDVIELRDLAHQITDNMLTGFPPPELAEAIGKLLAADGVIAVTPIFSASYSGLFKSFFDVIEKDALTRKAVLLGATGGTARHSLSLEHALRPLFAYLRATTMPTAVFAASEDWGQVDQGHTGLAGRIARAGAELARFIDSLPARSDSDNSNEDDQLFADLVPFEQQLAGN